MNIVAGIEVGHVAGAIHRPRRWPLIPVGFAYQFLASGYQVSNDVLRRSERMAGGSCVVRFAGYICRFFACSAGIQEAGKGKEQTRLPEKAFTDRCAFFHWRQ